MQSYTEIQPSELPQYANNIREALQSVCVSHAFRTSPKSCAFLRHIVDRTLSGDTEELKERLIGMSLLGREASYDTGSDAGVRVRANDVRKRLAAYNHVGSDAGEFTFELPSGSYVPRFFRDAALAPTVQIVGNVDQPMLGDTDMPLPLQRLAAPTFVALFLCVICLRWQIAQEHPFTTFWQGVFQGPRVKLYLPSTENGSGHLLIAMPEVQAAAPILNLAGQFHSQVDLTREAAVRADETLISISPTSESAPPRTTTASLSSLNRNRLEVIDTGSGRRIFDRTSSKPYSTPGGGAALLTISNGPNRSIRIDGTDDASVNLLIRWMCERDTFPDALADSLADGAAVTQVVFPMTPRSQPTIFRELPSTLQTNTGKTP